MARVLAFVGLPRLLRYLRLPRSTVSGLPSVLAVHFTGFGLLFTRQLLHPLALTTVRLGSGCYTAV